MHLSFCLFGLLYVVFYSVYLVRRDSGARIEGFLLGGRGGPREESRPSDGRISRWESRPRYLQGTTASGPYATPEAVAAASERKGRSRSSNTVSCSSRFVAVSSFSASTAVAVSSGPFVVVAL